VLLSIAILIGVSMFILKGAYDYIRMENETN